jgi:hypothetical protein
MKSGIDHDFDAEIRALEALWTPEEKDFQRRIPLNYSKDGIYYDAREKFFAELSDADQAIHERIKGRGAQKNAIFTRYSALKFQEFRFRKGLTP